MKGFFSPFVGGTGTQQSEGSKGQTLLSMKVWGALLLWKQRRKQAQRASRLSRNMPKQRAAPSISSAPAHASDLGALS